MRASEGIIDEIKARAKELVQIVADYGAFVEVADRGAVSGKRAEATEALLALQVISKTEDFQANPKEYLGLSKIEDFKKVLNGQADRESPYYIAGATGWINLFDHDKHIERAVEAVERTLEVIRGGKSTSASHAVANDVVSRGEGLAGQLLRRREESKSKGDAAHHK